MLHAEAPARCWFDGTRVVDPASGTKVTMGPGSIRDGAVDLLRTGAPLAFDIETYGLAPRDAERIKAVGVGTPGHVVVFDPRDAGQAHVLRWLLSEAAQLYAHNSSYDVPNLVRNGLLPVAAIAKVLDTIIWARMAYPSRTVSKALGSLAVTCLGAPPKEKDPLMTAFAAEGLKRSDGYRDFDIGRPVYVMGLVADVATTARLAPVIRERARDRLTTGHGYSGYAVRGAELERLLYREQRINHVFLRRSARGLRVDLEFLDEYNARFAGELAQVADLLAGMGIKAGDSRTITAWCEAQDLIGEEWTRLKDGSPSGAKKLLERVPSDVVKLFLSHKEKTKISRDYLVQLGDMCDADDRIHPQVAVFGASSTGRASIGTPPLQQFPGPARGMILADEGEELTSLDWSQIEPVTAANLAGDQAVLAGYEDGSSDVYTDIAQFASITRKQAKVVYLADLYGQGIPLLSSNLNIGEDEARDIKSKVHAAIPGVRRFLDRVKRAARAEQCVPTISGRILPVERGQDPETGEWRVKDYMGVNYCLGQDELVLRSDLRHVPAGKIEVGDRLVAFDEEPRDEGSGNKYRRMRTAVTEKVSRVRKPSVTVRMVDGTDTVCSRDHLWLARRWQHLNHPPRVRWCRAEDLRPGDHLLSIGTWEEDHSREAGYLAGLYDGEGSLTRHTEKRSHAQLMFSQLPGFVCDEFRRCMDALGLPYTHRSASPASTARTDSVTTSGVANVLRVLGTLQPVRFAPRFEDVYEGNAITAGLTKRSEVWTVEDAGTVDLVSIQTSTRTLIANGLLSHNCIQGSAYDILAETVIACEEAGLGDSIYLTLHDELVVATEAAGDVRKIMESPPEALIRHAGRVPVLKTDRADLGTRWAYV